MIAASNGFYGESRHFKIVCGSGHQGPVADRSGFKRSTSIRFTLVMFASCLCALTSPTLAQQATQSSGNGRPTGAPESGNRGSAVEQLTAMLQSIEPYRPLTEVTQTIEVIGSTSMDALAHGWINGFKQFQPQAKVEISAAGSEEAAKLLVAKPSAIAMYSRPVTEQELAEMRRLGLRQPTAFVVAREALTVYVHATNPATSISGEQLRDVFTTDTYPDDLTWSVLDSSGGWNKKPMHVISRTDESGTQRFLSDFVFEGAHMRAGVSAHPSNTEVLQALSADPLGIAICGYRSSGREVKSLRLTSGATVIPCDDLAVLSLGQTDSNARASQEFVRYALCQAGQTQAILVGFFPVDLPLLRAGLEQLSSKTIR
jgi:phosphate transport system substrate-binding protein